MVVDLDSRGYATWGQFHLAVDLQATDYVTLVGHLQWVDYFAGGCLE